MKEKLENIKQNIYTGKLDQSDFENLLIDLLEEMIQRIEDTGTVTVDIDAIQDPRRIF